MLLGVKLVQQYYKLLYPLAGAFQWLFCIILS